MNERNGIARLPGAAYGLTVSVHSRTASVGQTAPDFTLGDQHGTDFHLSAELGSGPAVLVFLRGFG
jgi:hypothetical protein